MSSERDRPGDEAALTYAGLRQLIGLAAVSLPAVLLAYGLIRHDLRPTISDYYLTPMRDYFTGVMCVIGVFLLAYRFGTLRAEGWVAKLAGLAAFGVAFFHVNGTLRFTGWQRVHIVSAVTLFALLGVISFVFFPEGETQAERRSGVSLAYRILGALMEAVLVVLGVLIATISHQLDRVRGIFWLETVEVLAFGAAFLIKGRFLTRVPSWRRR